MMLGNSPMSEWITRYAQSHQHPVNRLCHTFGIPMIAASIPLFLAAVFVEGLWRSSMIGASCWWASAGGSPRSEAARSRCLIAFLVLMLPACGTPMVREPDDIAPWLREDPQRCLLARDLKENMEGMARRCAETFVRQNGYTQLPASEDSTRWVLEAGERGAWSRVLAARGGSLEEEATTVQCSVRQCVVFFRIRRRALDCGYRVVTMSQVFTRLRLEPGGVQNMRCDERRA